MGKQLRNDRHLALMEALASARSRAGMTQRDLARRLGRSHSFVGKLEAGERKLDVLEFIEIAEVLELDPGKFLNQLLRR